MKEGETEFLEVVDKVGYEADEYDKNMEAISIEVVLCVNRINILHQKKA